MAPEIPSSSPDALAGSYTLRPGRSPAIAGGRGVLQGGRLGALLRGRDAAQAPALLSVVFTLCSHAHRRVAEFAIDAARGSAPRAAADEGLILDTVRDHLRTLALEWPQRLGTEVDLQWLRACPVPLTAGGDLHAFAEWFQSDALRRPAAQWLAEHAADADLMAWCRAEAARLAPARTLAAAYPFASRLTPAMRPVGAIDADAARRGDALRTLGASLSADANFAQQPHWRGEPAENGPWLRLRDAAGAPLTGSAWTRLAARWRELAQVAAAPGAPLLASGAETLAEREAIGWCEMARGLLLHWVRLDRAGCIDDYRVLAPTEWNFHPQGTLARLLAELPPGEAMGARVLAAAFDPCVACTIHPD